MIDSAKKKKRGLRAKWIFACCLTSLVGVTAIAYLGYIHPILQNLSAQIEDTREARENVAWNVHQLHSEVAKLQFTALSELSEPPFHSELGLRYEIVLSRVDLLKQGNSHLELILALESPQILWSISSKLDDLDTAIYHAENGDQESIEETLSRLAGILDETARFALLTNQDYHRYIEKKREQALEQLAKSRQAVGNTTAFLAAAILVLSLALYLAINARKDAEEQRELAQNNAQVKSRFLASMSHEIRTPLNAVLGFSKLATANDGSASDENIQEYLENIQGAGEQLSKLVESVLDWSKIESQKLDIEIRAIDLTKQVENLYRIYAAIAKQKGREIKLIIEEDFPRYLKTDSTRLNQIMTNLVGNALKFTEKGKEIRIRARTRENQIYIAVEDDGIGIPYDKLWSIFNAFEQAESDTTRRFGGTGLGLAISKELAKLMGGDITVQSSEGLGSTFTVILPLNPLSQSEITEVQEAMRSELDLNLDPDSVVLLVEDGILNQKLIAVIFERLGLNIHIANNGREGVDAAHALKPDLILMDMQMPEMDGLQATRLIKESPNTAEIPIVFLTANAFTEDRQKAMLAGVDAFLTKPLQVEELKVQLHKHLQAKKEALIAP
ncbi:MAG: ATP-binding protein [Verrucomicrobiota bacterium]